MAKRSASMATKMSSSQNKSSKNGKTKKSKAKLKKVLNKQVIQLEAREEKCLASETDSMKKKVAKREKRGDHANACIMKKS